MILAEVMMIKRLTAYIAASVFAVAAQAQMSQSSTNVTALDLMYYGSVQVPAPASAKIDSVSESAPAGHKAVVTTMQGAPSLTSDKYIIEFHYTNGNLVVGSLGATPSSARVSISQGSAYVIDGNTGSILSNATLSLSGNTISLDAPDTFLSGASLDYAVTRWLPATINESTLSGGLSVANVSLYVASGSSYNGWTNNVLWISPEDRMPGYMPPGDQYKCPPTFGGVKVQDVDGDGTWDWEYPFVIKDENGHAITKVPGTQIIVDVVGLDLSTGAEYAVVIKKDLDGDGVIEQDEIIAIVGRCEYVSGQNNIYIEKGLDGKWRVHHININPANGDSKHYIYDPSTGLLKVYDGSGVLIWGPGNPQDCPYVRHLP